MPAPAALYGILFLGQSEAAFSNYRLWESIGLAVANFTSTVLCVKVKVVILITCLFLGMTGYYSVEVIEKRGGLKRDSQGKVVPVDKLITGNY